MDVSFNVAIPHVPDHLEVTIVPTNTTKEIFEIIARKLNRPIDSFTVSVTIRGRVFQADINHINDLDSRINLTNVLSTGVRASILPSNGL